MLRNFLFFIAFVLLSCKQTPVRTDLQKDSKLTVEKSDSNQEQNDLRLKTQIELITKAIDSIYKLKPEKLIQIEYDKNNKFEKGGISVIIGDSAEINTVKSNLILAHPIFVFDLKNTNSFFQYGKFSLLYFNDNESAKLTFMEIFKLFVNKNIEEANGVNNFYEVFDKGGAWFMYKDNLIIHKYRSCSDNSIENDCEDKLIHYMYSGNEINEKGYYMRYCCSCTQELQEIYK